VAKYSLIEVHLHSCNALLLVPDYLRYGFLVQGVELELRKLEAAVESIHHNLLYLKAEVSYLSLFIFYMNFSALFFSKKKKGSLHGTLCMELVVILILLQPS